ncbi:MAG: hypothetical protein ABW044_09215, partial [Cellvibrio sp.]
CTTSIAQLEQVSNRLQDAGKDLLIASNDEDACLRAQRNLMEIEAEIETFESRDQLEDLLGECRTAYMNASLSVESWGNNVERQMLTECEVRLQKAFELKRVSELERLIEQMDSINRSAYRRSPSFWADQFRFISSRAHEAKNLRRANELVEQGKQFLAKNDTAQLENIVMQLCDLIPNPTQSGSYTHDSGIH